MLGEEGKTKRKQGGPAVPIGLDVGVTLTAAINAGRRLVRYNFPNIGERAGNGKIVIRTQ